MKNVAMILMLCGFPVIGGCANTDDISGAHKDYVHPSDVPVMANFELKTREPIPTSETVGTFRRVSAAYSCIDAPGYNKVAAFYSSALIDNGWTHGRTAAEPSSTADSKQRWRTVWTKGRTNSQVLTITYEERKVMMNERERMTGEIRINIEGSQ